MQQGGERIEEGDEEGLVESEVGEGDPTSTSAETAKNTAVRRSTRATSKTPAETTIGKDPKQTTRKGKEQASSASKQAESATIRELLGASLADETGTANDPVDTKKESARQTDVQSRERTNLAATMGHYTTLQYGAIHVRVSESITWITRLFDVCAAFGAEKKGKRNELREEQRASISTSYTSIVGPKDSGKTKRLEPIEVSDTDCPGQENTIPGGITFNDNARTSSDDIGFIPYFEKNLRELHGLLPLTISNATWQAKAINHHTLHGTKKSKSDETGEDKTRYSGFPYPDKYAQSYADWSMNYQGFLDTLIKVCKYIKFAGWVNIHKRHCDRLIKTDGFMTGLQYDVHVRFNAFARRIAMDNGSLLIANISIFNETVAQASYGKARRFLELDFTDNPYAKGAEREGWDTATGKPFEAKETNAGRRGNGGQNSQQAAQQPPQQPASRQDNGKSPSSSGYRGNRFNPRHNDRDRYDRDKKDDRRVNGYNRDRRDDRGGKSYNL
ncbi:hypothetical protein MJO28_008062 [Puccinia striiformis f. sp. tritici]|uniref:Uncharacterized protein n=1 Tax=Puccinia striiformis f. sp. tritici TaxID=168172 RepID=A0ACC0EB43_9BASI|nr:hypothetical protein MJO28_008062 [Puccinia striiformis f. sp. tritici]